MNGLTRFSTEKLVLTARIESSNPAHAQIGVFQNGGKAGVLCVQMEYAEQIVHLIPTAPELLEAARKTVALNAYGVWCHECGDTTHTSNCVIAGLQAAIAKAEGRIVGQRRAAQPMPVPSHSPLNRRK